MAEWVNTNYAAGPSWVDLGTYPDADGADQFYGFFFNVNVKSLVWYVPENFEDAGYEVPETMEDLLALSAQIVEDGETPWCIGLGSGAATGWPATDWVEDIMLRTQPPEVYDGWTTNEIPFSDPRVLNALETFGTFARSDGWVQGGAGTVATTDFRDAPAGLFASPPGCYMHRQASFIPAFFPEGTVVGEDADFFYFPSFAGEDLGNPVLGGGTLMGITDPSDATMAFMEFLQTPFAHEIMMAQGGFLTPHSGVNIDTYSDGTVRSQGEILLNATTFRFDGSDLMPAVVGQGTFWTGMVDFRRHARGGCRSRDPDSWQGCQLAPQRRRDDRGPAARWPAPLSRPGRLKGVRAGRERTFGRGGDHEPGTSGPIDDRDRRRRLHRIFLFLEPVSRQGSVPPTRAQRGAQHQPRQRGPALAVPVSGDVRARPLPRLSGLRDPAPVDDRPERGRCLRRR
jgi:hypothetical protein